MKWSELQNKNTDELKELLSETRAELQNLNFQAHGRQLKQVHKINIAKTRKKWKCFFDMDQCKYGSMQIWILVLYFLSIRKFELIIDASAISVNYV